ncbi:MAG: GDSL-type esterase/lipase family protein [Gammaproteobacteria bacterium]|nr:GDSL-type esterase/lipase family protein [Gammaproteobacteria bacterium]
MMINLRKLIPIGLTLLFSLLLVLPASAQRGENPEIWEEAMQQFDIMDRQNPPPENAIVLTGSSSIARWNDQAASALAPLTVIPRGFGGSVMGDLLYHLDRVALRYNPRAILIYEGDNDTNFGIPEETIVGQFEQIIARVHEELPETRIYVLSVKPSVSRLDVWPAAQRVSQRLREIAREDSQVYYVDAATPFLQDNGEVMRDIFIADNLHFNSLGNLIWGSVIRAALMPREARHENVLTP